MIIHQFRHIVHKIGWLRFKVHDTHEAFLDHIHQFTAEWPENPPKAIWHGIIHPKGYYLGDLHAPITATLEDIAHECVHVACSAYRRTINRSVDLGDRTQRDTSTPEGHYADPEERFAYLVGSYSSAVIGACASIGMFADEFVAD